MFLTISKTTITRKNDNNNKALVANNMDWMSSKIGALNNKVRNSNYTLKHNNNKLRSRVLRGSNNDF